MSRKKTAEELEISGTYNTTYHKKRIEEQIRAAGKPEPMRGMRSRAKEIFKTYMVRAPWIGLSDSATFSVWCELLCEIEINGVMSINAAQVGQFKALSSDLGLSPNGRARMVSDRYVPKTKDDGRGKETRGRKAKDSPEKTGPKIANIEDYFD